MVKGPEELGGEALCGHALRAAMIAAGLRYDPTASGVKDRQGVGVGFDDLQQRTRRASRAHTVLLPVLQWEIGDRPRFTCAVAESLNARWVAVGWLRRRLAAVVNIE